LQVGKFLYCGLLVYINGKNKKRKKRRRRRRRKKRKKENVLFADVFHHP
jgi:rRNA processing protein Gar1